MSVVDEFRKANDAYASTFQKGHLPMPPARHVGGRESHDSIRSLVISEQLLGTNTVVVIHHTDCGMLTFSNDDLRAKIKQDLHANADHIDFLPFKDLEQSVRDDVATIKSSPLIPDSIEVSGFIYDVKSGKLIPVE